MTPEIERLREALRFAPAHVEDMLELGIWNNDTVAQWLSRYARVTPDKTAIAWSGGTLSYAEAHERALRLARAFTALGLRKGDVVAIQLPNVPEFVITYFATSLMGAAAVAPCVSA
jgi:2,3-dihydroxybenzoate-AMP ligase